MLGMLRRTREERRALAFLIKGCIKGHKRYEFERPSDYSYIWMEREVLFTVYIAGRAVEFPYVRVHTRKFTVARAFHFLGLIILRLPNHPRKEEVRELIYTEALKLVRQIHMRNRGRIDKFLDGWR